MLTLTAVAFALMTQGNASFDCSAPPDPAAALSCTGEELMKQAAAEQPPTVDSVELMARAAAAFRRSADAARDLPLKRRALERLELLFDAEHLDAPRDADPVLRELITLSPGEPAP